MAGLQSNGAQKYPSSCENHTEVLQLRGFLTL